MRGDRISDPTSMTRLRPFEPRSQVPDPPVLCTASAPLDARIAAMYPTGTFDLREACLRRRSYRPPRPG
ncbi:MAG: hypothetical protein WBG19_04485 [Thermoplasmata archaeon]